MPEFLSDFRFAVRSLARRPGFAVVVVATLALGIGAVTAIFSVVDALLVRPLPYQNPEELVAVWERNASRNRDVNTVAVPNFLAWKASSNSFADLAAAYPAGVTLTGAGEPERVEAAWVTPSLPGLLGIEPLLGRFFTPEEVQAGDRRVALLGHGLWQRRFGGAADVVGRSLRISGEEHVVVGVMPRGFALPDMLEGFGALDEAEIYLPLTLENEYSGRFLLVLGRLAPDVGLAAARTEMAVLAGRLAEEHEYNDGWDANLVPLHEQLVGGERRALLVLFGAVGLVLLIACVNVANLLLARATARQREIAVRTSLGATRGRLVSQLLTESLLLSAAGGVAGVLLAIWGVEALLALAPEALPRFAEIGIDRRVLFFAAAASLVSTFVFGLFPAFRATRGQLQEALREGERGGTSLGSQRLRGGLVIVEVALALMLLVGSGLLIRSFSRLIDVDPGFRAGDLASFRIALPSSDYSESERVVAFYRELLSRVETMPGVESAGAAMTQPFDGIGIGTSFFVDGPDPGMGKRPVADIRPVTPGYFKALGISLLQGRDFAAEDGAEVSRKAIVSEALVREFWPDGKALGKRVSVNLDGLLPYEVVGVVSDVRHMGLDTTPRSMIYIPHAQFPVSTMTVVARTSSALTPFAAAVREAVAELDKSLPVYRVRTMDELVASSVSEERFQATLLTVFAAVALALAAVGLYGLLAFAVGQRTCEIGVRLALGARRGQVLGLVVRRALALTLAGLALGLLASFAFSRVLESLLFEVSATDPWTYGVVAGVLLAVALAASVVPARRASRIDPITALRHE